ncbi:MAG TPA: hypothetical protein GX707_19540 [Epulopiscium sp.]|nr:hypothetical protein [Candidatus Epulonipiscium sp.]
MLDSPMIDNMTNQYKDKTTHIMKEFRTFTKDIDDVEIKKKVKQFLKSVSDPYMFVVMGEVKAGKSSFINALVGAEICKVSSAPCTDIVHEIRYGEENAELQVEENHKRHFFNNERLKNIAIVDTPGTDSIVDGHTLITENFIPSSDLLIVVLPAMNPHNDSVWRLVEKVKGDWNKKVLFVLQQKDLVDDETLRKNINAVKTYAMNLGLNEPLIFPISAEEEINDLSETSGYNAFRKYIKETVTDTNSVQIKEKSNIEMAGNMLEIIKDSFEKRYKQYESDLRIVENINRTIDEFRETHKRDVNKLIEKLMVDIDTEVEKYRTEIVARLDPETIKERFSNKSDFQLWLSTVNDNYQNILTRSIERKTQQAMRNYISEMESVLQKTGKYLEDRPTYLELENNIYGTIMSSKKNVVAEIKSTIIEVSSYNTSLFEASEELFMEVWEARSKRDRRKKVADTCVGVGARVVGLGTMAAYAGGIIGAPMLGPIIAGIVVTSILSLTLNKFLDSNIYTPNMMKEVEKAVGSFNIKVETAKSTVKAELTGFITQMFDNELINMEQNFLEFRKTTYMDDNQLPELKRTLGILEENINALLLN